MNVKCDLACLGLRRNLLVEHSRYYEPHASRSRRVNMSNRARRAEISDFYLRRTKSPAKVAGQGLLDCVDKLLAVKWLGKEFQRAELHRLSGHRNVTISGYKDDRNLMTRFLKLLLKIQVADACYFMMACSSNPASPPPMRGPTMGTIA
jgi:hypothetical protein